MKSIIIPSFPLISIALSSLTMLYITHTIAKLMFNHLFWYLCKAVISEISGYNSLKTSIVPFNQPSGNMRPMLSRNIEEKNKTNFFNRLGPHFWSEVPTLKTLPPFLPQSRKALKREWMWIYYISLRCVYLNGLELLLLMWDTFSTQE